MPLFKKQCKQRILKTLLIVKNDKLQSISPHKLDKKTLLLHLKLIT